MKTALPPGETLIREGGASLQRGVEVVGGRLFLTNQRLLFEPHAITFQRDAVETPLSDIEALVPLWTKLFGLLPIVPNVVGLKTFSGADLEFLVFSRKAWLEAIAGQMEQHVA
jgi:hypothetical protein